MADILNRDQREQIFLPLIDLMTDARIDRGLSQSRLATEAGYSRKYVTLVEMGERFPTLEAMIAICARAGVARQKVEESLSDMLDMFEWES